MTEIAKMYGGSLFELASEEGKDQQFLEELEAVCGIIRENPDYLRLLSLPELPQEERCRLLEEAFGGQVDVYLLNFMKILAGKHQIQALPDCCKEYGRLYREAHRIEIVTAVTAVALSDAQREALLEKLRGMTGKTIVLNNKVDPAVLGGVRLELDGRQIDGSVQHKLDGLRHSLMDTIA